MEQLSDNSFLLQFGGRIPQNATNRPASAQGSTNLTRSVYPMAFKEATRSLVMLILLDIAVSAVEEQAPLVMAARVLITMAPKIMIPQLMDPIYMEL